MKNICFVSSYACIGGAEKSLQSLICAFRIKGYHVTVIIGENGPLKDWLEREKIIYKIIPQPSLKSGAGKYILPFNMIRFLFLICNFLRKNKVDIVHTNTFRSRIYCASLKYFYDCRMIAHVRDIEYSKLNKFLIEKYDHTIAISNAVKTCLLKNINVSLANEHKIKVIYNGVEESNIKNESKSSKIKVAMFSRYDEWKCQHVLIEAIKILRDQGALSTQEVIFKLYGNPIRESEKIYYNKIVSLIEKYELQKYVMLMGFCSNPLAEMNKMDLIVCPSDNEPFGRVVIEAMSLKKIVIASNNGGIKEILGSRFSELTFPPRSPSHISKLIQEYLQNKNAIEEKYKYELYLEYQNRFSVTQLIDKIEKLYKDNN